jgi:hypothetical protein
MSDVARRIVHRARFGPGPEERSAATIDRKIGEAVARDEHRRRPDIPTLSSEALKPWLEMFSGITGRPMSLDRTGHDRRLTIV